MASWRWGVCQLVGPQGPSGNVMRAERATPPTPRLDLDQGILLTSLRNSSQVGLPRTLTNSYLFSPKAKFQNQISSIFTADKRDLELMSTKAQMNHKCPIHHVSPTEEIHPAVTQASIPNSQCLFWVITDGVCNACKSFKQPNGAAMEIFKRRPKQQQQKYFLTSENLKSVYVTSSWQNREHPISAVVPLSGQNQPSVKGPMPLERIPSRHTLTLSKGCYLKVIQNLGLIILSGDLETSFELGCQLHVLTALRGTATHSSSLRQRT